MTEAIWRLAHTGAGLNQTGEAYELRPRIKSLGHLQKSAVDSYLVAAKAEGLSGNRWAMLRKALRLLDQPQLSVEVSTKVAQVHLLLSEHLDRPEALDELTIAQGKLQAVQVKTPLVRFGHVTFQGHTGHAMPCLRASFRTQGAPIRSLAEDRHDNPEGGTDRSCSGRSFHGRSEGAPGCCPASLLPTQHPDHQKVGPKPQSEEPQTPRASARESTRSLASRHARFSLGCAAANM